jgi:hypothetical protein
MRPPTDVPPSCAEKFPILLSSPHLSSPHNSSSDSRGVLLKRVIALAMALLLAAIVQGDLLAQQAPNNGQYAPDRRPSYQQPDNAQPQPYGQQPYAQPSYPAPGHADPQQIYPQQGYGPAQVQPLNAQDIEQLVAPIALYPDALVAQVLTASTYPAQVAEADRWRQAQGYASSDQIAAGADAEPWDPGVKALTAFPQVLAQMDQNLHWTTELGNAYYNQPQDVLDAVQVMRRRAQAAGNLQSTPQEAVNYDNGNIVLAPVNPQVVYVPAYNPWGVYGQPISPYPGFSLLGAVGSFIGSSIGPAVRFGLGIAMTAFTRTPFGLLAWGLNWLTQSVLFHGSNYYSHSSTVADWGLPHGGPRAFSRGTMASNRSYRPPGGYGRPSGEYGGARSQNFFRGPDRNAFAGNRTGAGFSRGYQSPGVGYGGTSRQAYNSIRPAVARSPEDRSQPFRSQQFRSAQNDRSAYASNSYNRSADSYGTRAGAGYGSSMRNYRATAAGSQYNDFGKRSFGRSENNGFAKSSRKQAHSGGFHFGGRHAPKNSGGGKSFSRAHSGGGGHFGGHGHSGGKHRG